MKLNNLKNISAGPTLLRRVFAVVLCLGILLVSYRVLKNASLESVETVDVVRVKKNGLQSKTLISNEQLEKYAIVKKEYDKGMVLFEEVDKVVGQYAEYTIRENTILYHDQVMKKPPLKNEWLYQFNHNQEVVTVPFDFLEAGGDILTPGDTIRVRASFEEVREAGMMMGGRTTEIITEILFDKIRVIDLLNARGHSIYEVYQEVMKLPEEKRQEVLRSEKFLNSILPKSFILEATKEQADQYAKYNNKKNLKLTFTILSRKDNKVLMEGLPVIQEEVGSWSKEKEST